MANKDIACEELQSQDKDGMIRREFEGIIQRYTDKLHFIYEGDQSFTDEQHIIDVKNLLKYGACVDYHDEVDNLIKNYLLLKCIKDGKVVYVNPNKEVVFFSVNSEGMSIEQYFNHIATYAYVDVDFYEMHDISTEFLKILGVQDSIACNLSKTNGEYFTGNFGCCPEWHTNGDFRWKLTLEKVSEVLEYISTHPNAPDSMEKSSFIFKFLQNNETKLQGTVYIEGSTPNLNNSYADIATTVRRDRCYDFNWHNWNGKWLYTESMDLVAQSEITKGDLNTQLYGELKPESAIYEILGFKKNEADHLEEAAKDYDQLFEEQKFLKESEGKVQMDKLNNQQKENLENVLNSKTENAIDYQYQNEQNEWETKVIRDAYEMGQKLEEMRRKYRKTDRIIPLEENDEIEK